MYLLYNLTQMIWDANPLLTFFAALAALVCLKSVYKKVIFCTKRFLDI